MDTTPVLESIAAVLATLPPESVEDQLVTFDVLVGVSDAGQRPVAAQILQKAADTCTDPSRRERLLRAAADIASGAPCALTPDGLTAKQAAAAQTVTQEEWERRVAESPAFAAEVAEPDAEEDDDEEDDDYMEEAPPALPHLPVRHFFPGLVVRAARDFVDAQGRAVCGGDLLRLINCDQDDTGLYVLNLLVRTVRLKKHDHDEIIENAGNAWLQPVPTSDCLEDLCLAIEVPLGTADEDERFDDDDIERIDTLREDVERCREWLEKDGDRGPAPVCRNGGIAAKLFGRDHELAAWLPLLFSAVTKLSL